MNILERLKPQSPLWVWVLFIVGIFFFTARLILDSHFANSAFFYLAVPFVISVLLHQFGPRGNTKTILGQYINQMCLTTVVFLATSALLFEGFLCVAMFLPLYWITVTVGYLFSYLWTVSKARRSVHIIPLIVAILSLEGVSPLTTQPRENSISYTVVTNADIQELKENMAQPIIFDQPDNWFLSLFPMPTSVEAGSLAVGDIHKVNFTYKRWFFTNLHKGFLELEIVEIGENHVRTRIISNTSYLATYLKIKSTEVRFSTVDDERTEISLTINYDRQLDPAWYFGPLQRLAVKESAKHLMNSVIVRGKLDG